MTYPKYSMFSHLSVNTCTFSKPHVLLLEHNDLIYQNENLHNIFTWKSLTILSDLGIIFVLLISICNKRWHRSWGRSTTWTANWWRHSSPDLKCKNKNMNYTQVDEGSGFLYYEVTIRISNGYTPSYGNAKPKRRKNLHLLQW